MADAADIDRIGAGIPVDRWPFPDELDAVILSNPWRVAIAERHGHAWDRWVVALAGMMRAGYRRPHADAVAIQALMPADDIIDDVRRHGMNDQQLARKYRLPIVAVEGRLAALGLGVPARRHLRLVVG